MERVSPPQLSTVSLQILQEHNIQDQDIEQINGSFPSGTEDPLNWKTQGSDLRIPHQESDFSKMFSNLTRNRWDLERQDIQYSLEHGLLHGLCITIQTRTENARQSSYVT
jgi:hypothetical protein